MKVILDNRNDDFEKGKSKRIGTEIVLKSFLFTSCSSIRIKEQGFYCKRENSEMRLRS